MNLKSIIELGLRELLHTKYFIFWHSLLLLKHNQIYYEINVILTIYLLWSNLHEAKQ